jgi:regulator of protease activity HflC (stomatin/prohibitin superfamily)
MPLIWTVVIAVVVLLLFTLAVKVVKQYEEGVLFRLGRVIATRRAGLTVIVPFVDVLNRVSLRIVTMPIQSQGIITRDNVSVDVSAVAEHHRRTGRVPGPRERVGIRRAVRAGGTGRGAGPAGGQR